MVLFIYTADVLKVSYKNV